MPTAQDIEHTIDGLVKQNIHLNLNDRMAIIRDYFAREVFPPEAVADIKKAMDEIVASGILDRALKVGDSAPDFALPDYSGITVSLTEVLQYGPAVVVFYRGEWCPYCNLHLNALEKVLPIITELGG